MLRHLLLNDGNLFNFTSCGSDAEYLSHRHRLKISGMMNKDRIHLKSLLLLLTSILLPGAAGTSGNADCDDTKVFRQ